MQPYTLNSRAEALRWLEIAEKLLTTRDLVGSKTFATRAKESDPRLEHADQILAIADTLLAGEKQISNNHLDWYAILQLAHRTHDSELIAAQYRRLGVLLNPSRNKFAFAEHAFKLVSEAWLVLSNPSRKFQFDNEFGNSSSNHFNFMQQHHEPTQGNGSNSTHFNFMQEHSQSLPMQHQQFIQPFAQQQPPPLTHQQPQQTLNQQQPQRNVQQQSLNQQPQQPLHWSQPQQPQELWPRPHPQPQELWPRSQPQPQELWPRPQPQPQELFPRPQPQPQELFPLPQPQELFPMPQSQPQPQELLPQPNPEDFFTRPRQQPQPQPLTKPQPQQPLPRSQPQPLQPSPRPQPQAHQPLYQAETQAQSEQPSAQHEEQGEGGSVRKGNDNLPEEESGDNDDNAKNGEEFSFWTACPYCYIMYEYPGAYAECTLRCQNCKRAFHAVKIADPPPIPEGKDVCFYSWGFFPFAVSSSYLEKNKEQGSKWTPFSAMVACPQGGSGVNAGKRKRGSWNRGPRIYIDDDQDLLVELSSSDDSDDDDWGSNNNNKKKKKKKKKAKSAKGKGSASKNHKQPRVDKAKKVKGDNTGNSQDGVVAEEGTGVVGVPDVAVPNEPVGQVSKKAAGVTKRKQPGRVAKDLGKLDLNVKFSNEVEEPATGTSGGNRAGNGVEDNIEGNAFFEGLDEFLSSLPILSVVGDDKVKAG